MKADDRIRLQHMADALTAAIGFAAGRQRADLDTDQMLVLALVRAIEIVGEAASRVSAETRDQLPDLPWAAAMAGMRNRRVHAYFDISAAALGSGVRAGIGVPPALPR